MAVILALFCITLFNARPVSVKAETTTAEQATIPTNAVTLYDPSTAGAAETLAANTNPVMNSDMKNKWNGVAELKEYTVSPTGSVLRNYINSLNYTGEAWPNMNLYLPYTGDTTGFAGYIVWLEYDATMYSDSFYGLFGTNVGSVTLGGDKPITFIDTKGKINETVTGRGNYHHNNATEIADKTWNGTTYTKAYTYDFAGWMIIPATSYSADVTPSADTYFYMNHHRDKRIEMDLKIGYVGFYTDYEAVLQELGRCEYSFVDRGTTVKTASVQAGTEIVAPETTPESFVQDNKIYTFTGWGGYTQGMTISSDMTFEATYKVTDFHMVTGASIRTNAGSSGIRFTAEFDENLYNEVDLDDTKQFGMIITKLEYYEEAMANNDDLIAGLDAQGDSKYVLITQESKNPLKVYPYTTETSVTYRINGAITNIQYDHADWTWIGVGVVITEGETTEYLYAVHTVEDSARTTAFVASSALNDPTEDYDDTEKGVLKEYVYKTAAKLSGVEKAEFEASANKASYIEDYTLEVNGTLETLSGDAKLNKNVAGDEAYLAINATRELGATVKDSEGNVMDIACTVTVSDPTVLKVDGTKITVLKNGYSEVSVNCSLLGYSKTMNVYTGSTSAGTVQTNMYKITEASGHNFTTTGEIAGQPYYGYYWTRPTKDGVPTNKSAAGYLSCYPKDMSVYYVDYLISQGYQYVRIPFYVDTTMTFDKFNDGNVYEASTESQIRVYVAATVTGGALQSHNYTVASDAWCYYDMDIHHFRANMSEANNSIDDYGMKTAINGGGGYSYNNLITSLKNSVVYLGEQTFIKESGLKVNASNDVPSLGENIDLADFYETNGVAAKYTVDGKAMQSMTAVFANHSVSVQANVYTAVIGDGTGIMGTPAAWAVNGLTVAQPVELTMTVQNGLEVSGTTLIDVKGMTTDVALDEYVGAKKLQESGFDVTQTYVKRYSDGTPLDSSAIENTVRGIVYATVTATKDSQQIEYKVTLDLYNSNEAVEYETFGHTDSQFAVKAYYALTDNVGGATLQENKLSYKYLSETYVNGATVGGYNAYGMEIGFDDYLVLSKYNSAAYHDYYGAANLRTVYGYAEDNDLSTFTYLSMAGTKIQPSGPIVSEYNMDSTLNIYVTPRHSQAYYAKYSDDTQKLKMSFVAPVKSSGAGGESNEGILVYLLTEMDAVTKAHEYDIKWSMKAQNAQTMTIATIAENYDLFANMERPIYAWFKPQGRGELAQGLGTLKLGQLIF